ncbi:7TM receptor with intracellular HD hydrolase [uncultured Desulfobacterium sp.]|uniref:7TM receptor with intracellular HD hydrolase n=1 Tax=uncultured Desulfobacterium sp. TaxID=201089 RepID=A0A445N2K2_9BACT|nr:7TM receptor with intracellular HD hydrolase [uncultured Desulfobacterium sp.]
MTAAKAEKTKNGANKGSKQYTKGEKGSAVPAKDTLPAVPWFGLEPRIWYILSGLSIIIAVLLYPNLLISPKSYKIGDVADRDIKASHEFMVEDAGLTEKNRQDAAKAAPMFYDFDPTASNAVARIKEAFAHARESLMASGNSHEKSNGTQSQPKTDNEKESSSGSLNNNFFGLLDIPPERGIYNPLIKNAFPVSVENETVNLVSEVIRKGIVGNKMILLTQGGKGITLRHINTENEKNVTDLNGFYDLNEARAYIEGQKKVLSDTLRSSELAVVCIKLAEAIIKPNLTFNKAETELRKELARKAVSPFYFKVKKGEMLVREGERITAEHLLKISEQQKILKQDETLGKAPAMAVLIFALLAAMHLVGFMTSQTAGVKVKNMLFNALTILVIFLLIIACNFIAEEVARGVRVFSSKALVFAIPVASGAMLVSIFHGMAVAASFSVITCVLASSVVGGQIEFFVYFFISSLVAAHGVRDCRVRGVLIKTGLKVGLCNMVMALTIEALGGALYPLEVFVALFTAFSGGVFVAVIATGLLPLIEMAFGYTTDIKLLELSNLDQPLLKELMVQAPGSYHHSVIVSNMVEATAKAVNANPLLAKVAAYYHDIGKVKKPQYFIENQMDRENRHEKLAPSMSSLILISHVKDGVELAKKHKLGWEITNIIRQHHGTSLISYFYEKAKEQEEKKGGKSHDVDDADFRYPGPKPQTKEAGLVMLADFVEAASKSLVDPTVARIQGMVQKIINKVFSDGQLDECELTLKDLHEIAKSFNKTLSGIFHHRIEYPESVLKTSSQKKGENGDTDPLQEADLWPKKTGDKAESSESLKRLGL